MSGSRENERNNLFDTVQNISNHVLELLKTTGELHGDVKVLSTKLDNLEARQETLERANRQVISMLGLKMEPEKCAYLHNELEKRIFTTLKTGAKGWAKTAMTVLKIAAWAAVAFGGSAVGANALGLLKVGG